MRHDQPESPLSPLRWLLVGAVLASVGLAATTARAAGSAPPLPSDVPVDWSKIPNRAIAPRLGYGYTRLTARQTRALRREVRLPMAALATARTAEELRRAIRVAPLPDPSEPFVPVGASAQGSGDPFSGEKLTSFRDNPMKALGERLGSVTGDAAPLDSSTNPFGVAATPAVDASPASDDDPFATAGDSAPSGSATEDEDPFDF